MGGSVQEGTSVARGVFAVGVYRPRGQVELFLGMVGLDRGAHLWRERRGGHSELGKVRAMEAGESWGGARLV